MNRIIEGFFEASSAHIGAGRDKTRKVGKRGRVRIKGVREQERMLPQV